MPDPRTTGSRVTKAEWQRRAEAWRQIACEFAAHRREAYGVPVFGALRLREQEADVDWGDRAADERCLPANFNLFRGMP